MLWDGACAFGLGFDTASEIGLLAVSATAAMGHLSAPAIFCLPLLFAAGMSAVDTTDGVVMCKVYEWSFINPARKILYNLTVTSLSVALALVIGTIELIQVLARALHLQGDFVGFLDSLYPASLGYVVGGLFLAAWGASFVLWKLCRIEERPDREEVPRSRQHTP